MERCTLIADGKPGAGYCPLSRVKAGAEVRIKQLRAPPAVARQLREIGLCEEQRVRLIAAPLGFICLVCQARLALSPRLADMILVQADGKSTDESGFHSV